MVGPAVADFTAAASVVVAVSTVVEVEDFMVAVEATASFRQQRAALMRPFSMSDFGNPRCK